MDKPTFTITKVDNGYMLEIDRPEDRSPVAFIKQFMADIRQIEEDADGESDHIEKMVKQALNKTGVQPAAPAKPTCLVFITKSDLLNWLADNV